MLEHLIAFDKSLFLTINGCHNDFFDHFFWIFTHLQTWLPTLLVLAFVIIQTKKREAVFIILGLILTIVLSDQISSTIIKPIVERFRPSHDPSLAGLVHLVKNYAGGRFGFVSSHSANSFGVALFFSLLFRNKVFSISFFCWAFLNSYSRIYIGVHFPFDIIGGALVGLGAAYFSFYLLERFRPICLQATLKRENSLTINQHGFSNKQIYSITGVLLFSIILIAALNNVLFPLFK